MMVFWRRWFRREKPRLESTQPTATDRELIKQWIQNINDSLIAIKEKLQKIPSETVATFNESYKDRTDDVLSKLDALPKKVIEPLGEIIGLSKREVLAELIRISSHHNSHDSNDSVGARKEGVKPIHEISRELTGKQKRLLALLLDSGFLSYAEIGEKLGLTRESAKNFVNRLLRDMEKARLLSKQDTEKGVKVGVSTEIQDEILKERYRTTSNDSL